MKQTKSIFFSLFIQPYKANQITGIFRVKSKSQLRKLLLKLYLIGGTKLSNGLVKVTNMLVRNLFHIYNTQGFTGLVKYLKVCSVCVQQIVSGHHQKDLTSLGPRISRTKSGVPRVIPRSLRNRLSDPKVIRIILTTLALYRDILIPAKVKIKSITDGFTGDHYFMYRLQRWMPLFTKLFAGKEIYSLTDLNSVKPVLILKSSPQTKGQEDYSTSPEALLSSFAQLKYNHKKIWSALLRLIHSYPYSEGIANLFHFLSNREYQPNSFEPIGKLGLKHEPAGKMRVFAMVDPITQWTLQPIHDFLFNILRKHEMDGTFDQLRPLSRIDWGSGKPLYSLDLSSATDRLPIVLQSALIDHLFSEKIGKLWSFILVGREYLIKKENLLIKYAVGQPMGAKSSWAMLAYTHHFIVQVAAWESGYTQQKLYRGYAVLGDDIVIFNEKVARRYLYIIKLLGVECGLAKSVISTSGSGLEFAKRTIFKGTDVSPVPFKEFCAATSASSALLELQRKYDLPDNDIRTLLGMGYRSKSNPNNRINRILRLLHSVPKDAGSLYDIMNLGYSKLSKSEKPYKVGDRSILSYGLSNAALFKFLTFFKRELDALTGRTEPKEGSRSRAIPSPYDLAAELAGIQAFTNPGLGYLVGDRIKANIRELESCRSHLKIMSKDVDSMISWLLHCKDFWDMIPIMGDPQVSEKYYISRINAYVNKYFEITEFISSSQVNKPITPVIDRSPTNPYRKDVARITKLWESWARFLKK